MFYGCKSLITLPDISKWNIFNVNDISYMFYGCNSLISLPDISKWKISKAINIDYMLFKCYSLISFPDIYKWKIPHINDSSNDNFNIVNYYLKLTK